MTIPSVEEVLKPFAAAYEREYSSDDPDYRSAAQALAFLQERREVWQMTLLRVMCSTDVSARESNTIQEVIAFLGAQP